MSVTIYRHEHDPNDVPDNPPDLDLEKKRRRANVVGSVLGLGAGAGGGYYWVNKHRGVPSHRVLPKLLAIATAGLAMGQAGAYVYNNMYNPRNSELPENRKTASGQPDIGNLALPDRQKQLLAISKAYADKKRLGLTQDMEIRKQYEQMAMASNAVSPAMKKKAGRTPLPVILLA